MYIEFLLPNYTDSLVTSANIALISNALWAWGKQHQISYTTKVVKHALRVVFDHDKHYSFFAMTWNSQHYRILDNWRIVSDLNNKTTFDSAV